MADSHNSPDKWDCLLRLLPPLTAFTAKLFMQEGISARDDILPATGKRMDAPCCDVFDIVNGKIKRFDCYPSGTIIFGQLGVLADIESAVSG